MIVHASLVTVFIGCVYTAVMIMLARKFRNDDGLRLLLMISNACVWTIMLILITIQLTENDAFIDLGKMIMFN